MKLRNAHSSAFVLPDGRKLTVGEVAEVPETMRSHALVKAGVFFIVEEPKPIVGKDGETVAFKPAPAPKSAPRSDRGGK